MLTKRSKEEIKAIQSDKNNNEFIYQTNQSLNSLKDAITSLSLQFQKEKGERGSQFQELKILVENYLEESNKKMNTMFNEIEIFRSQVYKFGFQINICENRMNTLKDSQDRVDTSVIDCREEILELGKDIDRFLKTIENVSQDHQSKLDNACDKLRDELRLIKPKIDPLQVKLDEQISIMKNDHQGLFKEINLIKKDLEYSEKKIEAIFDKIGMKKAGE